MDSPEERQSNLPFSPQGIDFDLGLLIHTIRKSIIWAVLILLVCIGGAYAYLYYSQPVYESSTTIQIIN